MKRRKMITAIILLLMLLVSTSCQRKSTDNLGQSDSNAFSGTGTGGHIQKQLVKNLAVNAAVNAPPNVQKLNTLIAMPLKLDSQKVQELERMFIDNSKFTNQINNGEDKYVQTEDGKVFAFENGNYISLRTKKFKYIDPIFNLPDQPYPTADHFNKNKDLSFMPYQQAVNEVKKVLVSIGISVHDEVETYTLDHQTMQDLEEKLMNDKTLMSTEGNHLILKDQWSSEDDGYFMSIQNALDGIPVFSLNHGSIDTNTLVSGSFVYAYYSQSGLEYIFANFPYQKMAIDQKDVPIIGVENALAVVKEKYENVILTDPISITRIEFNYVPTLIDNSRETFRMVPAWCFHLIQEKDGTPSDMIIDATNGSEIL